MNKRMNLKQFRQSLGLTIDEMADKLGCTRSYLNDIELGKKIGSVGFWVKFQDTFGIESYDMWDFIRIKGEQ